MFVRCALLLAISLPAMAAPTTLTHSGRLLDAAGAPLEGMVDLQTLLYTQASGGSAVWTEADANVVLADGYFSIVLGDSTPLTDSILRQDTLFAEVRVDGSTLSARMPITSVPYARQSESAVGGTVDVSEVRIDGVVVVDSGRNASVASLTVAGVTPVALDPSECEDGSVPVFRGTTWSCAQPVDGGILYIAPTVYAAQTTSAGSGSGGNTGASSPATNSVTVVNANTSLSASSGGSGSAGNSAPGTNSVSLSSSNAGSHGHTINTRRGILQLEGYCNVASPTANNNCNTSPERFVEIRGDSDFTTYVRMLNAGGHTHSVAGHSHTVSTHNHSLPNHTHGVGSHSHTTTPHAHSVSSHTHAGFAHDHSLTVTQPSQGWVTFSRPLPEINGPEDIQLDSATDLSGANASPPNNLRVLFANAAGFSWAADSSADGFLVNWQAVPQ